MTAARRPTQLLHVDSSVLHDNSVSRGLCAALVERWRRADPGLVVTYRDLAANPIAHLSPSDLQTGNVDAVKLSDDARRDSKLTDELIDEFLAADCIVVGAPMYNFSISSQLKAWIDRVVKAGRTFRYTAGGPMGLAGGKRVVIVSSRGGIYTTPERRGWDFQENYLRLIFGFVGITDVSVVRAEGLALGVEARDRAVSAAHASLETLFHQAA